MRARIAAGLLATLLVGAPLGAQQQPTQSQASAVSASWPLSPSVSPRCFRPRAWPRPARPLSHPAAHPPRAASLQRLPGPRRLARADPGPDQFSAPEGLARPVPGLVGAWLSQLAPARAEGALQVRDEVRLHDAVLREEIGDERVRLVRRERAGPVVRHRVPHVVEHRRRVRPVVTDGPGHGRILRGNEPVLPAQHGAQAASG